MSQTSLNFMVQHVWPRTEEGGRRGKLRGQSKFHCRPMLISSEHVFNQEEVAVEMRGFSLTDGVPDPSLSSSMWHTSDALLDESVFSLFQSHIDYQRPLLIKHS